MEYTFDLPYLYIPNLFCHCGLKVDYYCLYYYGNKQTRIKRHLHTVHICMYILILQNTGSKFLGEKFGNVKDELTSGFEIYSYFHTSDHFFHQILTKSVL